MRAAGVSTGTAYRAHLVSHAPPAQTAVFLRVVVMKSTNVKGKFTKYVLTHGVTP